MARPALLLDAALAELLAATGARAVRVVDGRTGAVLAAADDDGAPDPGDEPGVVAGLLREALSPDAGSSGGGSTGGGSSDGGSSDGGSPGGPGDAVVRTGRSVHLLRPVSVAFVHLRLAAGGSGPALAVARRALAAPRLAAAVHDVLHARAPRNGLVSVPDLPRPRPAPPGRAPGSPVPGRTAAPRADTSFAGARTASPPAPPSPIPGTAASPAGTPVAAVVALVGAPVPGTAVRAGARPGARPPGDGVRTPALPQPRAAEPDRSGEPRRCAEPFVPAPGGAPRRSRPAPPEPARQPALAGLAAPGARSRAGALASAALAELTEAALPRRHRGATTRAVASAGARATGLPELSWARDLETLRRLAAGLRRLS